MPASQIDRVASNLGRGLADRVLRGFERAHMLVRQKHLSRDIEANHGNRNSGLKDDARGFWIHINIKLSSRRNVSPRKRGSHHYERPHPAREFWVRIERGRDVSERADWNQRYLSRVLAYDLADEFGGRRGDRLGLGLRKDSSSKPVFAMHVASRHQAA